MLKQVSAAPFSHIPIEKTKFRESIKHHASAVIGAAIAVVGVVALLATAVGSSRALSQNTTDSVRIVQLATNLTPVGLQRQGNHISLTVRNDYGKNVTAFVISPGTYTLTVDLDRNDNRIAPSETYITEFTLSPEATGAPVREHIVKILAVVFDDKTGDGDSTIVGGVLDLRQGRRSQLLAILPYMRAVLNSSDAALSQTLAAAETAIGNLPKHSTGDVSHESDAGRHNAKEKILLELADLRRLRQSRENARFRSGLTELIHRYERQAMRP